MSAAPQPLSKTKVNKAGKMLRRIVRGEINLVSMTEEEAAAALDAVETAQAWRATYAKPLVKVRMGLVSFVKTCGVEGAVSQRHKRLRRIAQKLGRDEITMPLTQMQDIGGCRVVVPDIEQLRRLEKHIRKRWGDAICKESDYITDPASSGYRALHLVVVRDDRRIEVQLRTEVMHQWADFVEGLGRRTGEELKAGQGPGEVLEYLALASELMSYEERDEIPPVELVEKWQSARYSATARLRS